MNLPNVLSLFRLALTPMFPIVFFCDGGRPWAAAVYAVACASDVLDGYLARRLHKVTKLGRILDPLADKLMSCAVLVCLAITYNILWWAVLAFALKEGCMGLGALIQFKKIADVPPSAVYGKIAAVYFFVVCFVVLLFEGMSETWRTLLVASAIAITMSALILYLIRFLRTMRANDKGNGP